MVASIRGTSPSSDGRFADGGPPRQSLLELDDHGATNGR
jgi:hypothetical protein